MSRRHLQLPRRWAMAFGIGSSPPKCSEPLCLEAPKTRSSHHAPAQLAALAERLLGNYSATGSIQNWTKSSTDFVYRCVTLHRFYNCKHPKHYKKALVHCEDAFLNGRINIAEFTQAWTHQGSFIQGKTFTNKSSSSAAQGGGGSFKNMKPIGRVGCCESRMAERIRWWTERWLELCFLKWLQWLQWLQWSPHHNCWM